MRSIFALCWIDLRAGTREAGALSLRFDQSDLDWCCLETWSWENLFLLIVFLLGRSVLSWITSMFYSNINTHVLIT
jgi:hypothetical protein